MELEQIIIIVHVLIALSIIGLIMLQQGKGADMGASFGAGSSQTVFGGVGGGNVLTKATAILATAFFATSFALAIVAKNVAKDSANIDSAIPVLVEDAAPLIPDTDVPAAASDAEKIPAGNAPQASEGGIPGVDD
jgi:preprotein translocase subunit SecG